MIEGTKGEVGVLSGSDSDQSTMVLEINGNGTGGVASSRMVIVVMRVVCDIGYELDFVSWRH